MFSFLFTELIFLLELHQGSVCQNIEAYDIAAVEIRIKLLQSTLTMQLYQQGPALCLEGAVLKMLALIQNTS